MTKKTLKKHTGFTLIELLVVIAIISLLSAIVLAAVTSARKKAQDAAVKESVFQYRSLLELEYSDSGSYDALQTSTYIHNSSDCTGFTGNYATQAQNICNSILRIIGSGAPANKMYIGTGDTSHHYSIMAYLPSAQAYYCMGDSGRISATDNGSGITAGCALNP